MQIGLTSSNTQGFALIKLEPLLAPNFAQWQTAPASANLLTDWQHARATITVNGKSGTGSILFDTGVTTGFLTPPTGVTPSTGTGPGGAECNGSNPATCAVSGTKIQVSFSVASFNYTVGANNGPQSGNPVSPLAVSVEQHSAPFLNTTVRFLQAFNYIYDAANGFIGLKATGVTPAQYAAYTPSGLTLSGAFQCFFNWAQGNFGLSSNGSQVTTNYSWPYTYSYSSSMHGLRYGPNGQTSIAVSSGVRPRRPRRPPIAYIFSAPMDRRRMKALCQAGCPRRVVSKALAQAGRMQRQGSGAGRAAGGRSPTPPSRPRRSQVAGSAPMHPSNGLGRIGRAASISARRPSSFTALAMLAPPDNTARKAQARLRSGGSPKPAASVATSLSSSDL